MDFEGGCIAENLGAKFGEYGSFLPTYQRFPAGPHSKTPPKVVTYSAHESPSNVHIENSGFQSSASQPARKAASTNGELKQEVFTSCGDKSTSKGYPSINIGDSLLLTLPMEHLVSMCFKPRVLGMESRGEHLEEKDHVDHVDGGEGCLPRAITKGVRAMWIVFFKGMCIDNYKCYKNFLSQFIGFSYRSRKRRYLCIFGDLAGLPLVLKFYSLGVKPCW